MIRLCGLTLNNFLSYEKAEINFEDLGLCLIQGMNKETNDSNEAGKSSIPSAICWCFFGKTIKGLTGDSVIHWDHKKNCLVSVRLETEGEQIEITRYRKCKDIGDAVRIRINDTIHEGKPTEYQPLIQALLGFDYEAFVNTTVYSQETSYMLGAATDAQRRTVFTKLLNLNRFVRAAGLAKEKSDEVDAQLNELHNSIGTVLNRLEHLHEEVEETKEGEKNYVSSKGEKIKRLETNLLAIPAKTKIKGLRSEVRELTDKLNEFHTSSVGDPTSALLNATADLKAERKHLALLEKELLAIKDKCPTCKRPFTKKALDSARREKEEEIAATKGLIAEYSKTHEQAQEEVAKIEPVRHELAKVEMKLREAEMHNTKVDAHVESIGREIQSLKTQENPYLKTREALSKKIKELTNSKKEMDSTLHNLSNEAMILHAAKDLLGKKGVPSYIMENSFGFIEDKANEYLATLSGGRISVTLDPERTLSSGERKEEITLGVLKDGREITYHNLSDGARQRLNIALLFAINSYCRAQGNFDFLLLDEVLDISLDETGQEAVMKLLNLLSREVGTIFVVTHKQGLADDFESVLKVEYDKGVSKIV